MNVEENNLISTFYLGESIWGLDTLDAQEVIRVPEITKVHNADEYIVGIINLRGRIVTVVDLSSKLKLEEAVITDRSRIIIVKWNDDFVGLLIDSISDVINMESEYVTAPPASMRGTQGEGFIDNVYQAGEQLIPILKIDAVLEEKEG